MLPDQFPIHVACSYLCFSPLQFFKFGGTRTNLLDLIKPYICKLWKDDLADFVTKLIFCFVFLFLNLVASGDCITDLNSLTQYLREQDEEGERLQRGPHTCD